MQSRVKKYIEKWKMISEGERIVVGVSGGADSVCLLYLLNELSKDMGFSLRAVHVNHGIRGEEALRDERFVRELCRDWGIPCEVIREDVPALAKSQKVSEEEAGRNVRRAALEQVSARCGGDRIALAHHQEDNAETFFLQLARGSRLRGLGGIYPVNGDYIRPLLCVSRREIEEFLRERAILYCLDSTNLEDTYARNRVRNHVIPFFCDQINERTVEHINATMEYLREVHQYLEAQTDLVYSVAVEHEGAREILVKREEFNKAPGLIQGIVLQRALEYVSGRRKDIGEAHILSLKELMGKQTGSKMNLPYGVSAVSSYEGMILSREKEESTVLDEVVIKIEKSGQWEFGGRRFRYQVIKNNGDMSKVPKKAFTKWFDYDIMEKIVNVRTRRQGDRIIIDKEGNSKKLKSYFVDEKIPQRERDQIPVLAVENQILWVVGYRQSTAYQVTEKTKEILEIVVDGGS